MQCLGVHQYELFQACAIEILGCIQSFHSVKIMLVLVLFLPNAPIQKGFLLSAEALFSSVSSQQAKY